MRVGPPLGLATLLVAGLSIEPRAFPCELLESNGWHPSFSRGLTLSRVVKFEHSGNEPRSRIYRHDSDSQVPIRFRVTEAPFPLDASLSMLVPEDPLPAGEYFDQDGEVAVVIDAGAPARPASLGTMQSLHINRQPSGCDCDPDACGPRSDEVTVVVELSGLEEDERSYRGNYSLVVREELSGLEEAFLMSWETGAPFDGIVHLYLYLDRPKIVDLLKRICVTITGVGWDGSASATVDLGCG